MPAKGQKKPIDEHALEKMAEKLWTIEEIAAAFRVSRDTIERRFAAKIKECRQRGTAKIRDLQWQRALQGSDRMILHMSKHSLGEYDKLDVTSNNNTNLTVQESPALIELITRLKDDAF